MLNEELNKYTKDKLINIMIAYDDYVKLFYEDHEDFDMTPVCLSEFINNDYQEMLDAGFTNYIDWCYN